MDQSEFGQFVAALWERQGWQTQVKRDDGRVFVAVQRPSTGEEGLLWAYAGDGEVGGQQVQQFAKLCQQYEVGESAIVTTGRVSDHARKVSEGTGVDLLDSEGIATVLERKGWTDLAEQYGGDGGGADSSGGSGGGDGDSPVDRLRALAGRAKATVGGALGGSVPTKPALAVAVVAAVLAAGVLAGVPLPFLGGGGAVSAESVSPPNSTSTLRVSWNAEVVDEIDPNRSDGRAYYPPDGEQFVLVAMRVNNTGEAAAPVKEEGFRLRVDGETYAHQPLRDHDGFMDFTMSPGTFYAGWTVFSVPEGAGGTLTYDPNVSDTPVAVEFVHDSTIPVNETEL
ncbi:restriction endonuclease [Halorussus sp. AFM4]|uniref:restriction endonuclease n=1 Tax=Halorussus sp. AFM4 TaxID=3421651 RepID=UPI003EB76ED1